MDPAITALVSALAAGAAAALQDTTTEAVKDTYQAIKAYIQRQFQNADLAALERKPESASKQASLGEDLHEAGAADDAQLLELAEALTKAIEAHAPQAAEAVGVDVKRLKADLARFRGVKARGAGATGAKFRESEIGELHVEDVEADTTAAPKKPPTP